MKSNSCIEDHIMETNATDTPDHSRRVSSNASINEITQQPNILENAPKNVDVTPYSRTFFRIEDFYAFRNGLQGFYTSRSRFQAFKGIERKLCNYWNTFWTIHSLADLLINLGLRDCILQDNFWGETLLISKFWNTFWIDGCGRFVYLPICRRASCR